MFKILVPRRARLEALPGIRGSPHCASEWSIVCSNATLVHRVKNTSNQFNGFCRGFRNRWLQLRLMQKETDAQGAASRLMGQTRCKNVSSSLFLLTEFRAERCYHVTSFEGRRSSTAARVYRAFVRKKLRCYMRRLSEY